MPGDNSSVKRGGSALDDDCPTLKKIAEEINLAEMLLLQYLEKMRLKERKKDPSQRLALDHLSQLVLKELNYLRKVRKSKVVDVTGSFATFKSNDGEFLVTVVPEEELQRCFSPILSFSNVKPRFATPVNSCERLVVPSSSGESIYYDACYELPGDQTSDPDASGFRNSIYGLLSYIFASTIGKMSAEDASKF